VCAERLFAFAHCRPQLTSAAAVATEFKFDLYEALEIKPDASIDDVKKSYRKLALVHHPDRNGGEQVA
jgi:preprotein translocase subunit Sec63